MKLCKNGHVMTRDLRAKKPYQDPLRPPLECKVCRRLNHERQRSDQLKIRSADNARLVDQMIVQHLDSTDELLVEISALEARIVELQQFKSDWGATINAVNRAHRGAYRMPFSVEQAVDKACIRIANRQKKAKKRRSA